jgi:hypothetical protein
VLWKPLKPEGLSYRNVGKDKLSVCRQFPQTAWYQFDNYFRGLSLFVRKCSNAIVTAAVHAICSADLRGPSGRMPATRSAQLQASPRLTHVGILKKKYNANRKNIRSGDHPDSAGGNWPIPPIASINADTAQ